MSERAAFAGGPSLICALAAVAIALALQISNGMFDPRAAVLAALATLAAVAAALWLRRGAPKEPMLATQAVLGAGAAAGLAAQLFTSPTFYGDPRMLAGGFRWLAMTALVVLAAYLCVHLRASLVRARFLLLLVCFAAMGLAVLRASPRPWVDVWILQQGAADALRHGLDPYTVTYPNIYGPETLRFYAPDLVQHGRITAFPYPPLTVLVDVLPHALFGDVRYGLLALMLGAAWAIARLGRGVTGELAALFVLFQPRTFFVLEQAWTEPMVLCLWALLLLLAARLTEGGTARAALLVGAAAGAVAASKQYSPILLVPLWFALPEPHRRRALLAGLAVFAAVIGPFLIWDPAELFRDVVLMQLVQPFRPDSLSLLSPLAAQGIPAAVSALGFLAGALVLAASVRARASLAQAAVAAAAAWLSTLLLNKQSFCNHWWFCAGLLCAAIAARARTETAS